MINVNEFKDIVRKTGRKPISCKCVKCKQQCIISPCLGTPNDIEKIIDAGHGDKIYPTDWGAGIMMGVTKDIVPMYQPLFDKTKKACAFFNNGLCDLHESGLKPTEGKLSHHTTKLDNFDRRKSLSWNVAKEWLKDKNTNTIFRIALKLTLLESNK